MNSKQLFIEENTVKYLLKIGIPINLQGFKYLKSAVIATVNYPDILSSVTKGLYPAIAAQFDVAPMVVERCMRHAIDVGCDRGGLVGLCELFDTKVFDGKYKPANTEIIALIAERIVIDLRNNFNSNPNDLDNNIESDEPDNPDEPIWNFLQEFMKNKGKSKDKGDDGKKGNNDKNFDSNKKK